MARRTLLEALAATLLLLLLLLFASGCGTGARSPAGTATETTDYRVAGIHVTVDELSTQPDEGGRDPPTGRTEVSVAEPTAATFAWVPNAVVERVIDGDTLLARIGDRPETVRLIGIDAPESVAPTRPVQCFGAEASLFLAAVLPSGTEITLVRDAEARDIYDRLLGYVVRSRDGLFVNLELVATGYAAALSYPPNDHHADAFDRAQSEAIASRRGLWGSCGGPDVPLN